MLVHNSRPSRNSTSRFKGVYRKRNRWCALYYTSRFQSVVIGYFDTEEEAARAYDATVREALGPEAFLNFRDRGPQTDPIVDGDSAFIPLAGGGHFRVDAADLPLVAPYYWRHDRKSGVCGNALSKQSSLTALLCGPIPRTHALVNLNGDPLDYRRANIVVAPRYLTYGRRRKSPKARTSIYKGVRLLSGQWVATLCGAVVGTFGTEEQAAIAYDEAARKRYGVFAALNFPRPGELSCLDRAA